MTKGNDLLEFMEKNYTDLSEKFINKHQAEWAAFVFQRFCDRDCDIDWRDCYGDY